MFFVNFKVVAVGSDDLVDCFESGFLDVALVDALDDAVNHEAGLSEGGRDGALDVGAVLDTYGVGFDLTFGGFQVGLDVADVLGTPVGAVVGDPQHEVVEHSPQILGIHRLRLEDV